MKHKFERGESETGCVISLFYLVAIFYAFVKYGLLIGLVNIIIPYSMAWDMAMFMVRNLR